MQYFAPYHNLNYTFQAVHQLEPALCWPAHSLARMPQSLHSYAGALVRLGPSMKVQPARVIIGACAHGSMRALVLLCNLIYKVESVCVCVCVCVCPV